MRKTLGLRTVAALAAAIWALIGPSTGDAYSEFTHQRLIEAAVEAMVKAKTSPVPPGVSDADWNAFTDRMVASTDSLLNLKTGLFGVSRHSSFPVSSEFGPRVSTYNDPGICGYHGSHEPNRDLNLLYTDKIRVREFRYYANRIWVPCAYTPLPIPAGRPRLGDALGPTLGWHAQSIDGRYVDTVLWSRPTNAGIAGLQKEMANRLVELGLGAVLVPFVCLAELIFGDGCDIDDSFDLAQRVNPITLIEGMIPGIGSISGADYVGVWHFIDVGALSNRYNDVRGMLYEGAGPSHPSAIDIAIMAAADLSGLSLNASDSEGPERYGAFDRVERTPAQWQAHSLGHTEFSPLDNLARGGWDGFVADPTSAWYLSWPLHAVGDAAAPHHVTGTTGWGHRPFEEAVERRREQVLPMSDESTTFDEFRDRVLRIGFDAFRAFKSDPSIQAFIEREARATRGLAQADGDWVFQDGLSVKWHSPFAESTGLKAAAEKAYEDELGRVRPFVELGVGYAIALLGRAGELARDTGIDPQTLCPVGGHFTGEGSGCADGPIPPPPPVDPLPFGLSPVTDELTCQVYGEVCSAAPSGQCCNNVPCISGRCRFP